MPARMVTLALVMAALGATAGSADARAVPLSGSWIGGYSLGGRGEGLDLRIAGARSGLALPSGRAIAVRRVRLAAGVATLELGGGLELRGRLAGGRITGVAKRRGARGRFELRRLVTRAPAALRSAVGAYRRADGSSLAIALDERSAYIADHATGRLRLAWRTGPDRLSTGAAFQVPYPFEPDTVLERDETGSVVAIRAGGVRAARIAERVERAEWSNGAVRLVGKLRIPAGLSAPPPAVAIVHGSEGGLRDGYDLVGSAWLARGFAVLSYDKRGGGESTGQPLNDIATEESLPLLAGDAAAAVGWLAARPDLDHARIGLSGGSQAGWTIPLAADAQPAVRFAVVISGPVTSVGHESDYSQLTGNGERAVSEDEARAALRDAPHVGFDPRPVIARLQIPVLWQWGAVDRSVFAPESADELALLAPGHDFTGIVYRGGDHLLLETITGISAEVPRSRGWVPGLFADATAWLAARGFIR
jgi:dienelactone hydrolase